MKYSQAEIQRIFIIRLEHGEILHEEIKKFVRKKDIKAGAMIVVGGSEKGSKLIVDPEDGEETSISPMEYVLKEVHEMSGTETIFQDEEGKAIVHVLAANGRKNSTITGCIREGVKVWEVMEIVLIELQFTEAIRVLEEKTGLKLLNPEGLN